MKTKKVKPKQNRASFGLKKPVQRSLFAKGTWKAVGIDPSVFSEQGMEGLVCFEELTDYRLVDDKKAKAIKAKQQQKQEKRAAKKRQAAEAMGNGDGETKTIEEPAEKKPKKKKKKGAAQEPNNRAEGDFAEEKAVIEEERKAEAGGELINDPTGSRDQAVKKKKVKKNKTDSVEKKQSQEKFSTEQEKLSQVKVSKPPKAQIKNWTSAALSNSEAKGCDLSAWKDLFVPPLVLKALSSLGFESPTPIQALALPPAIRDHMDILGAAETGSGKTLAFGIPIIHAILEWRSNPEQTTGEDVNPPSKVASLYLSSVEESTESQEVGEGSQTDTEEVLDLEDEEAAYEKEHDDEEKVKKVVGRHQPLLGLVLTPTRELAVQVKHHIDAISKFTSIKTAIVVGGMAQQKQRRMLKRCPEIIIATPGRLWDLVKEGHPHLLNMKHLRCLVIDEADRMVERGHFAELENLLEMLNTTHFNPKRQTFVFSATLTLAHTLPTRVLQKKKVEKKTKLDLLMEKVGITSKPKVIDLTRKEATVETLTETQILCQKDEKDYYLYYFLLQYPGRTMVFANSIDCIKRLNSLLVILDCSPLPLHANMHQKQRLKNLERFAERESCVLLTTDVAARGLDIPDVQHVIHYQVPRTSETYVHRSGRTARATKEGLSLLLIGPDDMLNFKKICRTLEKEEEPPTFPVETKCFQAIRERVDLARKIEKIEFYNSREKHHDSWFRQAAEALEVDLDEDLLLGGAKDEEADREQQKMIKGMKKHLKHLISQPVFKNVSKTKYPTQMGKLSLSHVSPIVMESAITVVSKEKKEQKLKKSCSKQRKRDRRKGKQQQ